MQRYAIAPGAFLTEVPGDKFKRGKISIHLITPGSRENATPLALLPHVLDRRCAAIPDPTELARRLFALYGADLSSESYVVGANRVLSFSIAGLKDAYALGGENLTGQYLELLCNILFEPKLAAGVFEADDVAIEKDKQADFLRSEMNDKRGYCLRQTRRKLYGDSPLGIESAGYLEDIDPLTAAGIHADYQHLLQHAQVEVQVCGIDGQAAAQAVAWRLEKLPRTPLPLATAPPLGKPAEYKHYTEPMNTVQGKLCIVSTGAPLPDGKGEAVMRIASALYGGLPTSRLFMNVREKQSLCYYCAAAYGYYGGTLTVDSGVEHAMAARAAEAILKELEALQREPVGPEELAGAKSYMRSIMDAGKDSPDVLMNWAFNEWLRGTNRSLDEVLRLTGAVTAEEVRDALAAFSPAVEYVITGKEGA
ncbi:MAG: insulinase family protein [Ruminococcaceae bacterium]|nr:insulinase family protein [Oscillospiraceae bacterium]